MIIVGIIFLSGCGSVQVKENNTNFFNKLKAGKVVLSGGECAFSWGYNRDVFLSLLSQEDWRGLAVQMNSHGCPANLAYYFLGRSAEGLGFDDAARKYYEISINNSKVASHLYSCGAVFEYNCWGFEFPQDSETRLAQLKKSQFKDMPMILEVTENGKTLKLLGLVKGISGSQNDDFTFFNNSGIRVCSGEFNLDKSKSKGSVSLNCFNGKFSGTGEVLSHYYNDYQGTYSGAGLIETPVIQIRILYGPNVSNIN